MTAAALPQLLASRLAAESAVEIVPLAGGITNRNFRVDVDGQPRWVVRVFGERTAALGVDREIEAEAARRAAAAGIAPEVVASWPDAGMLVTAFVPGETLTPATAGASLPALAAALRRVHEGAAFGGRFLAGEVVSGYLAELDPRSLPAEWTDALRLLDGITEATAARLARDGLRPCHNDLLPGNFLRLPDGSVRLIDWEYAGSGDRFFDLGNFAVNLELDDSACEALLVTYFGVLRPADLAHLHLMRLASDLRESAWGFLQAAVSDLDEDFPAYGRRHLERFLRNAADPRFAGWIEAARDDS